MELADPQARALHLGTIALAVVLLLAGLLAFSGPGNATARLGILGVLLVLLGVEVWSFLSDRKSLSMKAADAGWVPPAEARDVAPTAAPADQAAKMVLRCKQCGQVFPVEDTGARPLVAACPHCGKSGTIKVKG